LMPTDLNQSLVGRTLSSLLFEIDIYVNIQDTWQTCGTDPSKRVYRCGLASPDLIKIHNFRPWRFSFIVS